jgi:hypothetical protein
MRVAADAYVSTGHLPVRADVRAAVDAAYETYRGVAAGHVSDVYPALSEVTPHSFGICLAGVDGSVHAAGDAGQALFLSRRLGLSLFASRPADQAGTVPRQSKPANP